MIFFFFSFNELCSQICILIVVKCVNIGRASLLLSTEERQKSFNILILLLFTHSRLSGNVMYRNQLRELIKATF